MPSNRFIEYLASLARPGHEDRGALAHLRRGLGKSPGTAPEMFPLVVPWIPAHLHPDEQDAYFQVAAFFGAHPAHSDTAGGMGDTFNHLGDEQSRAGMERRFVALLNAHAEDLADHLRHAISLARSKGVPVNYGHLLQDMINWNRADRRVQRRWAREFWGAHVNLEASDVAAPAAAAATPSAPTHETEEE